MNTRLEHYRKCKIKAFYAKQYKDLVELFNTLGIELPEDSYRTSIHRIIKVNKEIRNIMDNMSNEDWKQLEEFRPMNKKEKSKVNLLKNYLNL